MNEVKSKGTILTFKRYEKKYLLSEKQYAAFMERAQEHLAPDEFFKSNVLSIYYDSDDYELIRRSMDKPVYKEKIRLRSYGIPKEDSEVFVELKKKYKGVVYKRRVSTTLAKAEAWLRGASSAPVDSQITREIDYFLKMNDVSPKAFVGADRTSYVDRDNPELRITIDSQIKCRDDNLSLGFGDDGEPLLKNGDVLMEIKIPGAAPMWLARILSEEQIFPKSFSKYGTYYTSTQIRRNN